MPVQPKDFLTAIITPEKALPEITCRNSISRGYYSAYLHAEQKLKISKVEVPSIKGGVHARLIGAFKCGLCECLCGGLTSETQSEIAGLLSLMKQLRTKADYKLETTVSETELKTVVESATKIISLLP